MYSVTFRVMLP